MTTQALNNVLAELEHDWFWGLINDCQRMDCHETGDAEDHAWTYLAGGPL